MGKFNTNTGGGGQIQALEEAAVVDLPTGPQEGASAPSSGSGSILEGIANAAPDPEIAGIVEEGINAGIEQEQAIEEQKQSEAVPDIITRRDDTQRIDTYNRKVDERKQLEVDSSDGGLAARAKNLALAFKEGNLSVQGLGIHGQGPVKEALNTAQVLDETGTIDSGFLQMASVITENTIADIAFNESLDQEQDIQLIRDPAGATLDKSQLQGRSSVSKSQGNVNLGQQLNKEWHKYKNRVAGNPDAEIPSLSKEQAQILGDVSKELYYEANKVSEGQQFLLRDVAPDGVQVAFTLTKHGADLLKKGSHKRKRMFPKQHVRPAKIPTPGGQLVGEGRVYTKRVSSKIKKPIAGAEVIGQAMANLNRVANVVDPQRLKILFATALPILKDEITDSSHPFAALNHVGKDKTDKFAYQASKDAEFDPVQNYTDLIDQLAQDVYGIARERKGANHLTYYTQAFTGRIAPQQTHFDPTTSKTVRFVTRNAVPSKASPGSRIERNLRQMYAMMLVPGADVKLPQGREKALELYTPTLVKYGKKLKAALDQISDAQVEAAADAIAQGIPITDPKFPQLPSLALDPNADADLIKAIRDKGEDGQAFIDGAIDFTNYYEKKLKGLPHNSYFNAYMDGKTNGLASNGIQMGSENVAYKTGVLRSQKDSLLDNNEDLRDDLKNVLLESVDKEGFDGALEKFKNSLPAVASKLYANRDLNKSTTMTFGYGMDLESFNKVIDEHLGIMAEADPDLKAAIDSITDGDIAKHKEMIKALHGKYVSGLVKVLDPNALKSRGIMKSAALLHALTNELFTMESQTGMALNFGGQQNTGENVVEKYTLNVDGKRTKRASVTYGEEASAAADKRLTDAEGNLSLIPGGTAIGGAAVGPIQSLDAATVALTASGKSWAKLRSASNGNPYLHTIYDAFKVDAMGYDVVLNEVNNNWLDAGMNWSYLEEAKNAVDSLREKWVEKNKGKTNDTVLSDNEKKMMVHLLSPLSSSKGVIYPGNLSKTLKNLIETPVDITTEKRSEIAFKLAYDIVGEMKKAGYDYANPPAVTTLGHLKSFLGIMNKHLQVDNRLNKMINLTNGKKKELKAKIKRDGNKVYQYYSH